MSGSSEKLIPGGIVGQLLAAWEYVLDFPLPAAWRSKVWRGANPEQKVCTAWAMSVLGFLYGLVAVVAGWVLRELFSPIPAAVVFAVLTLIWLELKDSGRGLWQLGSLAEQLAARDSGGPALLRLATDPRVLVGAVPTLALMLIVMFKLLALYLLFRHGAALWVAGMLAWVFAAEAALAALPELDRGRPLLSLPENGFALLCAAPLVLMLPTALRVLPMALLGTAVALVSIALLRQFCWRRFGGVTANLITLCGSVLELELLLVGLLLIPA